MDNKELPVMCQRIKALREGRGLSQLKLAELLKVSKQTISNYENNERKPDIDTLLKITREFNVSLDYLTGNSNYLNSRDEFMQKGDLRLSKKTLKMISTYDHDELLGLNLFFTNKYAACFLIELNKYTFTTEEEILQKLEDERRASTHDKKDKIYGLQKAKLAALGPHSFIEHEIKSVFELLLKESIKKVEDINKKLDSEKEGK